MTSNTDTELNWEGETKFLQGMFPGLPDGFVKLALEEMALCSEKNMDYRSADDPLGNFKRQSTILGLYPNLDLSNPIVIALIAMIKQLDASLALLSRGREGGVETVGTRLADVSVYAKLAVLLDEENRA